MRREPLLGITTCGREMASVLTMACVAVMCPPLPITASLDVTGHRRPGCSAMYAPLPSTPDVPAQPAGRPTDPQLPPLVQRAHRHAEERRHVVHGPQAVRHKRLRLAALRHLDHRLLATTSTPIETSISLPDLTSATMEKSPSQPYEPTLHDRSKPRTSSTSSRSARLVNPTRSQNKTLTTLRSSPR